APVVIGTTDTPMLAPAAYCPATGGAADTAPRQTAATTGMACESTCGMATPPVRAELEQAWRRRTLRANTRRLPAARAPARMYYPRTRSRRHIANYGRDGPRASRRDPRSEPPPGTLNGFHYPRWRRWVPRPRRNPTSATAAFPQAHGPKAASPRPAACSAWTRAGRDARLTDPGEHRVERHVRAGKAARHSGQRQSRRIGARLHRLHERARHEVVGLERNLSPLHRVPTGAGDHVRVGSRRKAGDRKGKGRRFRPPHRHLVGVRAVRGEHDARAV